MSLSKRLATNFLNSSSIAQQETITFQSAPATNPFLVTNFERQPGHAIPIRYQPPIQWAYVPVFNVSPHPNRLLHTYYDPRHVNYHTQVQYSYQNAQQNTPHSPQVHSGEHPQVVNSDDRFELQWNSHIQLKRNSAVLPEPTQTHSNQVIDDNDEIIRLEPRVNTVNLDRIGENSIISIGDINKNNTLLNKIIEKEKDLFTEKRNLILSLMETGKRYTGKEILEKLNSHLTSEHQKKMSQHALGKYLRSFNAYLDVSSRKPHKLGIITKNYYTKKETPELKLTKEHIKLIETIKDLPTFIRSILEHNEQFLLNDLVIAGLIIKQGARLTYVGPELERPNDAKKIQAPSLKEGALPPHLLSEV